MTTGSTSLRRPRLVDRIIHEKEHLFDYVIILGAFAVIAGLAVVLKIQFLPDSAHYLGMSLWFSGMSREDAFTYVLQQSLAHGYEPNTTPAQLFDWGLVQPRVVLPALAVPFVWVFGPTGLGILTVLITLIMVLSLYWFLRTYYGRLIAVVTTLLTMSSLYIMAFSLSMLTESLSALWGIVTLAIAYRYQRDRRWIWIILLVVVTTLSAFTRQATFIVAGAFVIAWLMSLFSSSERHKWHLPTLAVAGTAVLVQLIQTALFPFSQAGQYMRMTETDSLWGAIAATPGLAWNIVKADLTAFGLRDATVLIILALSFLSIVLFWRRSETHLLVGAMMGVALYNITNGTSTEFRYAIPGLVFYMTSVALVLNSANQKLASVNRAGDPAVLDERPRVSSQSS